MIPTQSILVNDIRQVYIAEPIIYPSPVIHLYSRRIPRFQTARNCQHLPVPMPLRTLPVHLHPRDIQSRVQEECNLLQCLSIPVNHNHITLYTQLLPLLLQHDGVFLYPASRFIPMPHESLPTPRAEQTIPVKTTLQHHSTPHANNDQHYTE